MKKVFREKNYASFSIKFDLKVKLTTLFLIVSLFQLQANESYAQKTKVTLTLENVSIERVLDKIESLTEFKFIYKDNEVDYRKIVSVEAKKERIESILQKLFAGSNIIYKVVDKQIILKPGETILQENSKKEPVDENKPQGVVIAGTVSDSNGQPLPGANIIEKGTTNGVQTDFDGKFSLEVAHGNTTLVVSYLGFETQEVLVNNQTTLTIMLKEDTAGLDEVVVVGYGTLNKRNVTGAIASVKTEAFKDIPITSVEQGIAGQLAGVEITQNSGQPGQGNSINVRGIGTITAGSQPLIVVDGLPLSESTSLNTINPNDIASIEVLKDAASAAIYGSRGANGVVIITTKKGISGEPQFSFNSYAGFQQVANKLDLMNASEHAIWDRDARNNYYLQFDNGSFSANDSNTLREANAASLGFNPRKAIIPSYVQAHLNGDSGLTDTDWQDELFRNALIQNHQLSVKGGNENISYFVSGNYFNQEGIVLGSDFERFSFRTNLDVKLSKKLNFGINLAPSLLQSNEVASGFSTSPINGLVIALPYFPAYNADGSLAISQQVVGATEGDQSRAENPVAMALLNKNKSRGVVFQGGTFLELELIEGLKAKTYWGVDFFNSRREIFSPSSVGTRNVPAPKKATASNESLERMNWIIENTLSYSKTINEKHNINGLIGYSYQEETSDFNQVTATDFPNDFVTTLNAGIVNGGTSTSTKSTLVSYLARLRYDFDGKYLVTAAVRRDGSSRFGANNKFGVFPSVSVGYRISDESFFPESGFINDLKLRASWGLTGNNQIGDFGSQAVLGGSNAILGSSIQSGLSSITSPNPNLGWEETSTVDVGLDFGFLNNSITASLDYYIATTNDLLLDVPVPAHSGFTESLQNIGKVENKGIEFAIRANYNLGAVKAVTSFNIASNKNKVLELGPGQDEIITGRNITRIGGELGASYGYRTNGIFTSQDEINSTPSLSSAQVGEYIYVDANGDGQINSSDRVILGSIHPDYTFGMNTRFTFKNFDLGAVIQGVQGVHIHDRTVSVLLYNPEGWNNGARDYFNNYYTPERGANSIYARPNTLPRDNGFYRETDILQEDASFVRIRNITLGYTLPETFLKTLNLSSLRLYVSSKNPFTFTDYRGYNPEQRTGDALSPTTGFDNYPVEKSFVFGVNLNF